MSIRKLKIIFIPIIIILVFTSCKKGVDDDQRWEEGLKSKMTGEITEEKICDLGKKFSNPSIRHIDEKYFYIVDNYEKAYIYKTEGCSFYKEFGRKGEGPGEWRLFEGSYFYPDKDIIMIYGMGKILYYTKEGKYIREFKYIGHPFSVGNNYVQTSTEMPREDEASLLSNVSNKKIILLNSKFEKEKVLISKNIKGAKFVYKGDKLIAWLFSSICDYRIYKNKIIIGYSNDESFNFDIFDSKGHKIREIKKKYNKIVVPYWVKKKLLSETHRSRFNHNKKIVYKFFKYYPSFSSFEVYDDKIYIYMFPDKDKMRRVMIMDMRGNYKGSIRLLLDDFDGVRDLYRGISNYKGYHYYIRIGKNEKKWELWREKRPEYFIKRN